ncbi:unnamed protein product [Symbiodinium microadriaticum]|nr:unnamed protein product [Symbiodinium microadriaticum]CAE7270166.1 unnamed protein product [Symbiodinium sp. KB8]
MAEEDKSTSAWYKVPTWDGSPATWRSFQREMQWWLCSLDVESTKKFNLAARWLLRQSGVVRQRGEEFSPKELEYTREVRAKDPEGVEIVVTPEDPFSGINKLLAALEEINGKTALDKKGELRRQFYTELSRRPGERPADFLSRFRFLVAELKSEGIDLPSSELGWFVREKLGLDPLRKQRLGSSRSFMRRILFTGGSALIPVAVGVVLRLRRPLVAPRCGARLLARGLGGRLWEPTLEEAGGKGGQQGQRRPFFSGFRSRQAFAAEVEDELPVESPEADEEELLADGGDAAPDLDEVLETEAEALAAELEQAENEGVDPNMLEQLEGYVENAAEALITMRDAKTRLQEVRRDRGFGKAGPGPSAGAGGKPSQGFKKRGVCHDCGLPGHWAGDAACNRPGAGLAKPKRGGRGGASPVSSAPSGSPHRPVQLVETFAAEAGGEEEEHVSHEVSVVSTLEQALEATCPREALRPLLATESEKETFKFGNDGTKASLERHRLPVTVGDTVVCVWASVVEVPSLGLLLGRDFLEAIGGVISFTRRALRADHLDCRRIPLQQLSAGHFYLDLLPKTFFEDVGRRWTRQGADGVLEVQAPLPMLQGPGRREERVCHRLRRMCLRLLERNVWHFVGVLLWLLQRPSLRYVPLPYSNTRSVEEWKEQAEAMVKGGALPRRHFRLAVMGRKFEDVGLLKDAGYLRDRLGIKLAFMEDPMLPGMLAARYTKGVKAAIQNQLVDRLRKEAEEQRAKGKELESARSLLGPKGGLPTLKADLLRLAVLLHVEVQTGDTVDKLKAKLRPTVEALKVLPQPATRGVAAASSSAAPPSISAVPRAELPGGAGEVREDSPERPAQRALPEVRTAGPMALDPQREEVLLQQMQTMIEARDQRMEGMLAQAMQRMMTMQQQLLLQQEQAGEGSLSPPDSDMGFRRVDEAWRKGKRDRDLVKVGAKELRDALEVTWAEDWDSALSAPFVAWASDRPMSQRSGFGDLLLAKAAAKGHAVTWSSRLPAPFFLLLRAVGRSPFLNLRPSSRPAAEKKSLDAEAAVMAQALAHRRSGRHFFLELLRGTPEGRELMDEPSLFDFSVNGIRYVTSSPAVAKVFCDKGEAVDATALLSAIEEQFGMDHKPGNVTEALAAETDLESDFAGGHDGTDTEDEAVNQEPDKEVPVSAAVRQAVRRLRENTGHRSPKRLARALVIAGAPMEAVIAAKQLRCSVCEEKRPPKAQRPASLPAPREAGDQIALDIFDAFDAVGTRFSILHAVDAVTRFQMAEVVDKKSSQEVVRFLKERWCPVFGTPRTIVMDQGREFISHEVERYAIESNVYLFFISVQAPWQNGLCERVGGMLKTVLAAATASQSLMGLEEMKTGLGEALLAYNMDVGDSGFSPMQAAVGRQPLPPGDALGNNRLGEIDSMDQPGFSRLVAVREAARMAMLRLHFSSSLRRAEKARSRNPTVAEAPAVGDLVYYWREQKYNRRGGVNKRRLLLRKWHGTLTKVALEHVRRASPMEQIASGEWDAVLQEVVAAAERDQEWEMIGPAARQDDDGTEHDDLPEEGAPVRCLSKAATCLQRALNSRDNLQFQDQSVVVIPILDLIGLIVVTDAKDTYDKGNSDTPSYGSQKSLAFTVAWLRGMIAKPNVALRWQTLDSGEWSFRYDEKYVKQAIKPKKPLAEGPAVLTGTEVAPHDPMIGFLQGLCNQPGWHKRNDMAIQVAFRAKSFRRPEPRFEPQKYPLRSTFALYHDQSGRGAWRLLEKDCRYGRQLKPLDREAPVLITLFRTHKEKETNVESEMRSSGPEQCEQA